MDGELVNLTINGKTLSVPKGTTVYAAAQKLGIEIPIFCYHDRMPPFGACRMCLVEVDNMPKPQTSCTLEAREGMNVKTASPKARSSQEGILELLLINHPLDCPVCDKGGECPLQDQTLRYGPGVSRFFEKKRQFVKPIPLGPVLMLDRERCIQCARCTRFGEIVAGDHALEFIDRGFRMEVGTHDGGPAESKYIGNTIAICPVGALTSLVYRFRARPWDNESTESTCTLCPVGCSMIIDSRDGEIMRTRVLENKDVNDVWLCDKGWFGYQHVESSQRLNAPLIRKDGSLEPASWEEALDLIANNLKSAKKAAAFGGNPLTFEENYLFQGLFRTLKIPHLDHRIGTPIFTLDEEYMPGGMEIAISALEDVPAAILLGCDITEEFPLLWLRLKRSKLFFIGHYAPEVASFFHETILHAPGEEIVELRKHLSKLEKGAILVGSQYLHLPHRKEILSELVRFKEKNPHIALHILDGNEGSKGARVAGMHPQLLPFGVVSETPGLDALSVLKEAAKNGWDFLWVAGANPARKFSTRSFLKARSNLKFLVVQDLFLTETALQADVVLPTLSFIEKEGSFINIEGRVQKLNPGKDLPPGILSDKDIFLEVAKRLQINLEQAVPESPKPLTLPKPAESKAQEAKGGLKAVFSTALFDHGVRMQHNTQLVQMAKEPALRMHPEEIAIRGLNSMITVTTPNGEVKGKLKADPKVSKGTIVLPNGFKEIPVEELELNGINGLSVEVK